MYALIGPQVTEQMLASNAKIKLIVVKNIMTQETKKFMTLNVQEVEMISVKNALEQKINQMETAIQLTKRLVGIG